MIRLTAPADIPAQADPRWLPLARAVQAATGVTACGFRDWSARSAEIPGMECLSSVFAELTAYAQTAPF